MYSGNKNKYNCNITTVLCNGTFDELVGTYSQCDDYHIYVINTVPYLSQFKLL
jgi:hypothetical protein